MKKVGLVMFLCFSIGFIGCTEKGINQSKEVLNSNEADLLKDDIEYAEEYGFDTILKKGYLIRETSFKNNKEKDKIYNKDSLDKFIEKFKNKERAENTIVEYLDENNNLIINKLYKINYDGEKIIANYYDVYSNKEQFELAESLNYKSLDVKAVNGFLEYFFLDDSGNEIKLISFNENEIIN